MSPGRSELDGRTPGEVLQDHIRLRERGELEADLARNYAEDVVVLTGRKRFSGHDGIREVAALLAEAVDPASYRFQALVVDDRVGLAEWVAHGPDVIVRDGVDSYLVEDGRIRAQTVHYTAESSRLSTVGRARPAARKAPGAGGRAAPRP